jgi:hypothetical protein
MVKSCANNLENPGFKNKTVSSWNTITSHGLLLLIKVRMINFNFFKL